MDLLTQLLLGGCGKEGSASCRRSSRDTIRSGDGFADALAQNLEGTHAARK